MSDLIERQKALDALKGKLDVSVKDTKAVVEYLDGVIERILQLPSAEPEWIPVSEGLPEDYQDVLVWFEYFRYGDYNCMYSTYGIGNYSNRYDSWLINHETGWTDLHVFAWMPMPEPYREGEEE